MMGYEPGNSCVHQIMYQKTTMIMETEKDWALFYFNCVLRDDEVGGDGRPRIRCTDNGCYLIPTLRCT